MPDLKSYRLALLMLGSVTLASCSSLPEVEVVAPASWSSTASSFEIKQPEKMTEMEGLAIEAVRQRLVQQGWREQADEAQWQVQVAYAERPVRYGVFSDESARQEEWLASPKKPPFWVRRRHDYSLMVSIDGGGLPRGPHISRATVLAPQGRGAQVLDQLADFAVAGFGDGAGVEPRPQARP